MRNTFYGTTNVTWYQLLNEMIDMRSFSNLWFWIALAVTWSTNSHWVLGVPYDMVVRAAKHGAEAETDLDDVVRVNINRTLYIFGTAGVWLLGFTSFLLATLIVLGFVYDVELAQALFLLAFPLTIVAVLRLRTARQIRADGAEGAELRRRLTRHRIWTQVIGMISIFVTTMWGIYQNLSFMFPDHNFKYQGSISLHDEDYASTGAFTDDWWRARGL
ncbi:component of SufBCD complex [Thalassovita taeanensis]|uniref:Component of SufBCD complex n=1 Tax=Thalassovita taeanensis TaxID=657014 RepID=A0A1H8YZP1_9RHOB|nr:hypothetical protein SAMN04488092_101230 [Thalassovita taeanensis]